MSHLGRVMPGVCRHRLKEAYAVGSLFEGRSQTAKASSFSKAKNTAFVRKWNKENTLLYGEKLKVKRVGRSILVKSKENVASFDNTLDSRQARILEDPALNSNWLATDKDRVTPETVEKLYVESTNGTEAVSPSKKFQNGVILKDLELISHFPLFIPPTETDDTNQKLISHDDIPSDIPILKDVSPVSVSQILNKTKSKESQFILNRWIKGQIEELGKEGFAKAQKDRLRVASTFHGCVEQYLTGTPVHLLNMEPEVEPYWQSVSQSLQNIEEVLGVEVKIQHSQLKYHGTADCLGQYKGETCVIEWKTSGKQKASVSSLYEYPLQVASYLGGLHSCKIQMDLNIAKVENMLIVVAYEDGSPAHAHFISRRQCMQHWAAWCQRLQMFWRMKLSGEL